MSKSSISLFFTTLILYSPIHPSLIHHSTNFIAFIPHCPLLLSLLPNLNLISFCSPSLITCLHLYPLLYLTITVSRCLSGPSYVSLFLFFFLLLRLLFFDFIHHIFSLAFLFASFSPPSLHFSLLSFSLYFRPLPSTLILISLYLCLLLSSFIRFSFFHLPLLVPFTFSLFDF